MPTGDPTCPVYVRNAKRIFDRIKEAMELSDGEGGGSEDDDVEEEEGESEPVVAVPHIPPTGDMDVHAVFQREDAVSLVPPTVGEALVLLQDRVEDLHLVQVPHLQNNPYLIKQYSHKQMPERHLSTEKLCDVISRCQRGLLLFVSEKFSLTPPPDLNVEI
jgi:hypothetical protein